MLSPFSFSSINTSVLMPCTPFLEEQLELMAKHVKKRVKRTEIDKLERALQANGAAKLEGPKRKHWTEHDLRNIKPLTSNQEDMFREWFEGNNICAHGVAGSGKSILSLYLAFSSVIDRQDQSRIIIIRSVVPTREIGFLKGTADEKVAVYEAPYHDICYELFGKKSTYDDMKDAGIIQFVPTSFVRGLTWDNAVIIVEEFQNLNWSELDSIMTRVGQNSRVIITGDHVHQRDLIRETNCTDNLLKMIKNMKGWGSIEFTIHDIVRSDFVKQWITCREQLQI